MKCNNSGEKGGFYIFEALGLHFWHFLKQICKRIGCKLTVFYKNYYFFMQILPENVKIFNLTFTVGVVLHPPPTAPPTHTPGRNVPVSMLQGAHEINV